MPNAAWFLADLTACEQYLTAIGLHPVCDASPRPHVLKRLEKEDNGDLVERFGDVLDRVPIIHPREDLWAYVLDHPDAVWIGGGCQFGHFWKVDEVPITPGRLMGTWGFSVLSGSYGGISIRPWTGLGHCGIGGSLVSFRRGEVLGPEPQPDDDEDDEWEDDDD